MAGVLVADDPFLQSRRDQLIALTSRHKLPAIYFSRDFVEDGGLMSYGPSINDAYGLLGCTRAVSSRVKAHRPSCNSADQVRACHQSKNSQGAQS